MVNEKQTKRERNIRSKLMAAIAMLLVSSIMMVSTTYAWFTLSTAPEVTGITTSIAANGNLEIALSPASGLGSDVGDATTQTQGWVAKNLTWGNLVDMSDASYGLSALTLAPSELAASVVEGGFALTAGQMLATPSYGANGRISELKKDAILASKDATGAYAEPAADAGFVYGVRAVGTSSGQSVQERNFKTNVNGIVNYANAAITAASNSLSENGNALASMLVQHAEAGSGDTNNYAIHVPALVALTSDLDAAVDNIELALKSAILAAVSSIEDETLYTTAYNNLKDAADLAAMKSILEQNSISVPDGIAVIETALSTLSNTIGTSKSAAESLMNTVDADKDGAVDGTKETVGEKEIFTPTATVTWSNAGGVLTALMNTDGDIKVSGYTITEIKEHMNDMNFLLGLATNCQIELGAGSGVYYDLAALTGNINAKTTATVTARGMTVTLDNVMIKTMVPANTAKLPLLKTAVSTAITPAGGSTSVLDAYYGYVIDLMVRTNAADSSLKLQTAAAQRVYSDSASEATMGGGTTFIFKAHSEEDVNAITDLCRSLRLVFFDPTGDSNKIFGMAKASSVLTSDPVQVGEGVEYTVTATLELCQMVADGSNEGLYLAGDFKADAQGVKDATLCPLTQNVPQAISVLVYLDGNNVTSSDVLANEDVVGYLNLQFASSANLKPMQNSELLNMTVPATTEAPAGGGEG